MWPGLRKAIDSLDELARNNLIDDDAHLHAAKMLARTSTCLAQHVLSASPRDVRAIKRDLRKQIVGLTEKWDRVNKRHYALMQRYHKVAHRIKALCHDRRDSGAQGAFETNV